MTHETLTMMPEPELEAIVPDDDAGFGSLSTARGHLPLEAMDVTGRVVGLVAELELRQTFVNTFDEPIEATYIFPLSDRAAVTSFRMEVDGRVVDGAIKERGEARREYDEAIEAGHRAAITEEERSGVFTIRVGNLIPDEKAVVRLTMTGPLPVSDGEVTFRFPLVVAPRYIPGRELAGDNVGDGVAQDTDVVPDASRITPPVLLPGYPNPVRLGLRIDVEAGDLPVRDLRSSLHAVVDRDNGGSRRITLQPGERLDRDFILRYSVGSAAIGTSLVLSPDAEGDEGTFMLTLVPPAGDADATRPRDVVFVLDRSCSMSGWKMVAARRAVARMVDTLGDDDTFNVLAFDNTIETPAGFDESQLVAATDRNRFRAVEFLAKLDYRGGTEMARPLELAAGALAGGYAERERVLVLVTDGQVGNEDHILRNLQKRLKNVRIFTLGIDRAVNAGFLRRLATLGAGACELVESEDRLDEVMDKIHRRIATPIVTELSVKADGLSIIEDSIVPGRLPDLFANAPLTVTGRFRGKARGGVRVSGQDLIGSSWSQEVFGRIDAARAVTQLWARGLIRQLEDEYVVRGAHGKLEQRIVSTSITHSVLSRFTAFVAVDREGKIKADGFPHQVTQAVDMPSGWVAPARAPMHAQMRGYGGGRSAKEMMAAPASAMPVASIPPRSPKKRSPVGAVAAGVATGIGAVLGAPVAVAKALANRGGGGGASFEEPAAPAEPVDLQPYLDRLVELVAQLRATGHGDVERRLKRVAALLHQLIEDLQSIDVTLELVRALAPLAQRLADELRSGAADAAALAVSTADELEAIAQGTPDPGASTRGAFWK